MKRFIAIFCLISSSAIAQDVLMLDTKGAPLSHIDPTGFRSALLIDTDLSRTQLLPKAPAEDGKVLTSANGAWVAGASGGGGAHIESITAQSPLVQTVQDGNKVILSITAVWLTPEVAAATYSPLNHSQGISTISGLQSALDSKAAAVHSQDWSTISGTPGGYPPNPHTQAIASIIGLQSALDSKAATSHFQDWSTISGTPASYPPNPHSHEIASVTGLQSTLDAKAPAIHSQDWSTITGTPASYPPNAHTQSIASITGLEAALDAKASALHSQDWSTITGTPAGYPPNSHTQSMASITGLEAALDAKASALHSQDWSTITGTPAGYPPNSHTQNISSITGLQIALDSKAAYEHGHDANQIQTGVLSSERVPGLDAKKIVSGVFEAAHIPELNYEQPLGNPASNGMILSSTAAGVRSWVPPWIGGTGTSGTIAKFSSGGVVTNSVIREVDGKIGVGMEPMTAFQVHGDMGTDHGTLYADGPLQVAGFATIRGTVTAGSAVVADRSAESSFRGAYTAADGTAGATAKVQVRDAAGTGTLTLHFKNGLFVGTSTP